MIEAKSLGSVRRMLADHGAVREGIAIFKGRDELDRRTDSDLLDFQRRPTGIATVPAGVIAVAALGTTHHVLAEVARRLNRLFLLVEHRLRRQWDVLADLLQRDIIYPEVAGCQQAKAWVSRLTFLLDLTDVGQSAPAKGSVLVQMHVVAGEHELGRLAIVSRADVQPT